MQTLADAVLARVRSLVRDGDPSALVLSSLAPRRLTVDLTVTQTVEFDVVYSAGAGGLTNDVERLTPGADLEAVATHRMQAAAGAAPRLLRHWADHYPDYRARLRAVDCVQAAAPVGTQLSCGGCGGSGRIRCDNCGGRKVVQCSWCRGRGQWPCTDCDRRGNRRCSASGCYGSGWVSGGNGRERCVVCHGQGTTPCGCSNGVVLCTTCGQRGMVECPPCRGSGAVDCGGCAATGVLHRTASTRCRVHHEARFDIEDGDEEDATTLRRVGFDALGDLGTLARHNVQASADALVLQYRSHVPVETVAAACGATSLEIRGFGPDRRVVDYHGLVEHLLTPDLLAFEGAVSSRFRPGANGGAGLGPSARAFLASEIHALIASRHGRAGTPSEQPADDTAAPLVAENLVSATYVQRAEAAIRKALPHLYRAFLLPGTLAILSAWILAGVVAYFEPLSPWSAAVKLLVLTALAAVAWGAWEIAAARKLQRAIGVELYTRLSARFRPMRQVSWALVGSALASVVLVAVVGSTPAFGGLGRRVSMAEALHDALALDVETADVPNVRAALQRAGAHVAYDKVIDRAGLHQIRTDGARGYSTPGVERVMYTFSDGHRLSTVSLSRSEAGDRRFAQRIEEVGRLVPLVKRTPQLAFFRGPTMQVTVSTVDPGSRAWHELYEGYVP
jgi:hypothetical protein